MVPTKVILSPPSKLRFEAGDTEVTVHPIVSGTTEAALGMTPRTEIRLGAKLPQVGSLLSVHSRFVAVIVAESGMHSLKANITFLISVAEVGRLVPVITTLLVAESKVNEETSPTGSA